MTARDIEDLEDILTIAKALVVAEKLQKKKRMKRKVWVRPWVARRSLPGRSLISLTHDELAVEDPAEFRNVLRMNEDSFNHLLSLVDPKIRKQDTNMRQAISSRDRLTLTLRFLATGVDYSSLQHSMRIPKCTISQIVPEVCQAIYESLKEEYLKMPSTEAEWEKIADEFQDRWNYPNCIGAMDGRHIAFRPPRSAGSTYYNYKSFHSVVLLALVDADYKFISIDVGTNGRVSDGGVYRESNLSRAINANTLNIPPAKPLPHRHTPVPFVIVADDAFSLSEHLMKPYPLRGLSRDQRIHNYRLTRARRISENAFGILANRFRILLKTIQLSPKKVQTITLAVCALHNYLRSTTTSYMANNCIDREENGVLIPGNWREENNGICQFGQQAGNRVPRAPIAIRDEYKNYFVNEGAVSWQDDYV